MSDQSLPATTTNNSPLPSLRDPESVLADAGNIASGPSQDEQKDAGIGAGQSLSGILQNLENISDPFSRELARSFIEGTLSQAVGFRINLPDPEDIAMREMTASRQRMNMARELRTERVLHLQATLLDMTPEQKLAAGLASDFSHDALDDNPGAFLEASAILARYMNRPELELTRGDLLLGGFEEQATMTDRDVHDKSVKASAARTTSQVALLKGSEELVELLTETADGDLVNGLIRAIESQEDVDLTVGDTDFDEKAGAVAGIKLTNALESRFGPRLGSMIFMQRFGGDIRDALEDQPAHPETKTLMIGTGADQPDIDPPAVFYNAVNVAKLAQNQGGTRANAFRALGLPFQDIDPTSFFAFAAQEADKLGEDPIAFLMGLGLSEETQRDLFSSIQTGATGGS